MPRIRPLVWRRIVIKGDRVLYLDQGGAWVESWTTMTELRLIHAQNGGTTLVDQERLYISVNTHGDVDICWKEN